MPVNIFNTFDDPFALGVTCASGINASGQGRSAPFTLEHPTHITPNQMQPRRVPGNSVIVPQSDLI